MATSRFETFYGPIKFNADGQNDVPAPVILQIRTKSSRFWPRTAVRPASLLWVFAYVRADGEDRARRDKVTMRD